MYPGIRQKLHMVLEINRQNRNLIDWNWWCVSRPNKQVFIQKNNIIIIVS